MHVLHAPSYSLGRLPHEDRQTTQLGHVLKVVQQVQGMDESLMARLKELEEENRRLKKMYAEERLKAELPHEFGIPAQSS